MFRKLLSLFGEAARTPADGTPTTRLEKAATLLLAMAARLDGTFDDRERTTITRLLSERFGLSADEARALLETADREAETATDFYAATRIINGNLDFAERVTILEMLWEVAYADGVLHDYEANLVRRVAGLLHVADRDSGFARQTVIAKLGLAEHL